MEHELESATRRAEERGTRLNCRTTVIPPADAFHVLKTVFNGFDVFRGLQVYPKRTLGITRFSRSNFCMTTFDNQGAREKSPREQNPRAKTSVYGAGDGGAPGKERPFSGRGSSLGVYRRFS